jgi:MFS family permease
MKRPAAVASLAYRDFRLLWLGQCVSQLGTQVQTVALGWLVYTLTGSAAQLGGIGLARAVPIILLSLFGGTLADRADRRKVLLVSQSTLAVFSAGLALAVSSGRATVLLLYLFALVTAAATAFDAPARQALIPALVPRERLANALTLNILAQNLASVLGPAIGGFVIGYLGTAACFWLDAVSFFAVVAALLLLELRQPVQVTTRRGWDALVDGLRFVRARGVIWQLMLVDFMATLFVSMLGLLPVFAKDVLEVGPQGLGFLYAAPSAGAISGALLYTVLPLPKHPGRVVVASVAGYGLALACFGVAPDFGLALVALGLAGGLDAISSATRQVTMQLATPDAFRGRVGALASVFYAGGPRLGQFQSGVTAELAGPRWAMLGGGAACIAMTAASRLWGRDLWSYAGEELGDEASDACAPANANALSG